MAKPNTRIINPNHISTIAIDGPAASGKSTIGYALAKRLNYMYLDTGVMYRAVTWAALQQGVSIDDESAVTALAEHMDIEIVPSDGDEAQQCRVLVDGQDVTSKLRRADVEHGVSLVSAYAGVRDAMVMQQRRISKQRRVVMVGRDIGTIVLPDADLKIYLDARVNERALRRYRELAEHGQDAGYDSVLRAMERRDAIDSARQVSPLQPAQDALIIDTTNMTIDQVLDTVERLVRSGGDSSPTGVPTQGDEL